MEIGAVIIAVAGVAGTLGGAFLTQRTAERSRRREIELVRGHTEEHENLALRRASYVALNRDARQFTTALNQHLHALREREVTDADRTALDEAKRAHRDQYSEAQMIASDEVLARAAAANRALNAVYGQVKRLERAEPEPGETAAGAAEAQYAVWGLLRAMRATMRRDLGATAPEASE
ncbi:hypothetical protein OG906_17880 [Streptomyces sp. NBC_01426]|uniref:hypothetical protein n=1 Tax=Streptomyces sp. NBC_01426 TaxID=2975866 RepID=UPI002E33923E|nr:hypothetical protein [Streptomyces sp. NBC_01426]